MRTLEGVKFIKELEVPLSTLGDAGVIGIEGQLSRQRLCAAERHYSTEYRVFSVREAVITAQLMGAFTATTKKGEKVFADTRMVISEDGKTMTATSKGTDADGKQFNNTFVYEKQ